MNLPKLTQTRRTSPILLPLNLLLAFSSLGQAQDVQKSGDVKDGGPDLYVGRSGNGTLAIRGDGVVYNQRGFIGDYPGSTGLVTVSGGSWTNTGGLAVGVEGNGTLGISGTGAVSNTFARIGDYTGSTGLVTVSGGSWTNTGGLAVGYEGNGTLEISGTGAVSAASVRLADRHASGGTLKLLGGTLSTGQVSEGSGSLGGTVTFGGGTLRLTAAQASLFTGFGADDVTFNLAGGTIDTQAFSVATAAALSGVGGLTKEGTGMLTLSGVNTYTGPTTIAAGRLAVNGSTSPGSAVGVSSGGTLAGSGTVGGSATISSGGMLAPGNSPGVLTVTGTTTFSSGSIFEWELDTSKSGRGIAYDGVNTTAVTGSDAIFKIMLTGTQDFTDAFWNQTREWTDIFKSADGSTTLSDWAGVFGGGFQYAYNGKSVAPTSAGAFALSGNTLTWSAVPEPSNLLAGLLAASALLRRRRDDPVPRTR